MAKSPLKPSTSKELENLKQQVVELTTALQRERADAMNVRRRSEEERLKQADFYKALIVRQLLPVIDDLERSLKHVPVELEKNSYVQGVSQIIKQFEKVLSDIGVERITTVNQPFDPRYHEAVVMEDSDGNHEVVSEELQAGYKIGDEIIRHAMVKVKME
ncbi:MAG: nucleotide exchange factor GrpE [Candidatus Saccharimonadales bacterium]